MSATGRGGERRANDDYPTPSWCVRRLLEVASPPWDGRWLEPCTGSGSIVEATNRALGLDHRSWWVCDIDPRHQPLMVLTSDRHLVGDFLTSDVDWAASAVITNPPYALAEAFVTKCVGLAPWVAMLLRINWMNGKHAELLRANMPDVYVLPNRPEFVASLKCKGIATHLVSTKACGYRETMSIQAFRTLPRPLRCACEGALQVSTTDATEYAWYVWDRRVAKGRTDTGCVRMLADTPRAERLLG